MKGVAPLIKGISFEALLADKAFDVDWLLRDIDARGAIPVIPSKANRTVQSEYDFEIYKWRHMVENYFAKIKEFRGIATRYDKTGSSYTASWYLAAALIEQDECPRTLNERLFDFLALLGAEDGWRYGTLIQFSHKFL
jgi:transposase